MPTKRIAVLVFVTATVALAQPKDRYEKILDPEKEKIEVVRANAVAIDDAQAALKEYRRRAVGQANTPGTAGRISYLNGVLQDRVRHQEEQLATLQQRFCDSVASEMDEIRQAPRPALDIPADLERNEKDMAALETEISYTQKTAASPEDIAKLAAETEKLNALRRRLAVDRDALKIFQQAPARREEALHKLGTVMEGCRVVVVTHQIKAGTAELEKETSRVELENAILAERTLQIQEAFQRTVLQPSDTTPAPRGAPPAQSVPAALKAQKVVTPIGGSR
jgi:hypothetical protein